MIEHLYRTSRPERPHLRIGLLLDAPEMIRFFADIVADVARSDFASLTLAVMNQATQTQSPRSRSEILRDPAFWKMFGWTAYERLDQKLFPGLPDPMASVDCSSLLAGVETLPVTPLQKGFTDRFPDDAVEAIRARDLDVVLRFGFRIIRGGILSTARYGVWSYHHDDSEFYRGGPAQFWELYEDNPLSGVTLQVLNEELDAGMVLQKGIYATERGFSLRRNRVTPYFASRYFVIQKLKELQEQGWEHLRSRALAEPPYRGQRKIYRRPTNTELATWAVPRLAAAVLRRPFLQAKEAQWRVGLRRDGDLLRDPGKRDFTWVQASRGHFYADPFLATAQGRTYLLFEDYLYAEKKGVLSAAELHADGTLSGVREILRQPYHLSYPFVFEEAGQWYLLPEAGRSGGVELFIAEEFPWKWRPYRKLFPFPAVDTTLHRQDGVYYWFTSVSDPVGGGKQMLLFTSDRLDGEWQYHPANPVSCDVRQQRGAGALFSHEGRLFRPVQDCSLAYGYATELREVLTLSPARLEERPVQRIEPWLPGMRGTHTYNRDASGWETVDGCWFLSPSAL